MNNQINKLEVDFEVVKPNIIQQLKSDILQAKLNGECMYTIQVLQQKLDIEINKSAINN